MTAHPTRTAPDVPDFRDGWEGTADECPVHVLPLDEDGRCPKCLLLPEEAVKELSRDF